MHGTQRALEGHLDRIHTHAHERRLDATQRVAEAYAKREAERPIGPAETTEPGTADDRQHTPA